MMKNFSTGFDHLVAELQLLALLLQRQVLRLRAANLLTEDGMRGLYISDTQVDALLSQRGQQGQMPFRGDESKGVQALSQEIERLRNENAQRVSMSQGLPLSRLALLFDLKPYECQILLISVAPELDLRYEILYAYVQNDVTKKHPSVDMALRLLFENFDERVTHHSIFDSDAPLIQHKLVRLFDDPQDREPTLLSRYLKADQRIVDFLLDKTLIDQRLLPFTRRIDAVSQLSDLALPEELRSRLIQLSEFLKNESAIVFLHGPYGVGKQVAAEAICTALHRPLLIADLSQMPQVDRDIATTIALLRREALLQGAGLYLAHFETLLTDDVTTSKQRQALIHELIQPPFPVFLGSEVSWYPVGAWYSTRLIDIELPVPDFPLRLQLWQQAVGNLKQQGITGISDEDITMLANQFVLSGRQIQDAVSEAIGRAALRPAEQAVISGEDFYSAARAQSNHGLRQLAQKVELFYAWDDIILPQRAMQQLHEVCAAVKYRHIVFSQWDFEHKLALGKGVNILFSGPSGTGKTMAASIVANELERDLYKIDLSNVVSKYIGETEKNLSRIFREAQASNAILFFDEADALFGKRSEVKDAHDRYANIEVAYLLQQMEEYTGIVILATNLSKNLDEAFARRMQHTIEFPFPDAASRERIWHGIFPEKAPVASDVDFGFLARQFELTGGNIRNIALAGALMAAEEGDKEKDKEMAIRMEHLIIATARELQKLGKMPSQANFRNYYDLMRQKA
jgi:SpoVK/Ycf46/Vps4 family AAA+-type ATPase